jgi:heme-degrading monooxygenase HmoA
MSYAFYYDVPGDEHIYRQVRTAIGDDVPPGLVAHFVVQSDTGLRHYAVWDSAEDWNRFNTERARPAVHAVLRSVGFTEMPPDPEIQELKLIDTWIPAST